MTMSQLAVMKLYNAVVDDVIAGVRDCFLDDGVDEQVLQELKQLWKTKLTASGAMDPPQVEPAMPPPPVLQNFQKANGSIILPKRAIPADTHMAAQSSSQQSSSSEHPTAPNMAGSHPHQVIDPSNRVPVQLTLPAQPGIPGSQPRSFTIQIPAAALNGNKLHQVLTGPIISATLTLPEPLAATLLQQHINSALAEFDGGGGRRSGPAPFISLDGALDSSDDEGSNLGDGSDEAAADEDDDEESADEKAEEEEEERDEIGGAEEEPLNSGDDVSDEEPGDMFDTDNVVVCQYDKITRSRNKWKFHLKDGIMNLGGKDYVFQKANGDAEW